MEACFITKPNIVYKCWFLFYLVSYQITKQKKKKQFMLVVGYFDVLFYLFLARERL